MKITTEHINQVIHTIITEHITLHQAKKKIAEKYKINEIDFSVQFSEKINASEDLQNKLSYAIEDYNSYLIGLIKENSSKERGTTEVKTTYDKDGQVIRTEEVSKDNVGRSRLQVDATRFLYNIVNKDREDNNKRFDQYGSSRLYD